MKFFFSDLFEKRKDNHQPRSVVPAVREAALNITDGSEFLDDAIRFHEQPFMYTSTEESVAPGSPKDLW